MAIITSEKADTPPEYIQALKHLMGFKVINMMDGIPLDYRVVFEIRDTNSNELLRRIMIPVGELRELWGLQ